MGALVLDQEKIIDSVAVFLKNLSNSGFYGTVELQFVHGELVLVREEKTYKPAFLIN